MDRTPGGKLAEQIKKCEQELRKFSQFKIKIQGCQKQVGKITHVETHAETTQRHRTG